MSSIDRRAGFWLLPVAALSLAAMSPGRHTPLPTAPTCPARQSGVPLKDVSVFDGPVSEMAELVPEDGRKVAGGEGSRWDLAYVYQAGRVAYARCRYGAAAPQVIPLTHPVKACRLLQTRTATTLTCR